MPRVNIYLQDAIKLSHALTDYEHAIEIVKMERLLAEWYRQDVGDKAILLAKKDGSEFKVLEYFTRFSEHYRDKVRRKVWKLFKRVPLDKLQDSLFVTLTIDPERVASQKHAKTLVAESWNRLLTRMRKDCGPFFVFRTFEWQKNGLGIHVHALFFGLGFYPIEKIRETWDRGAPRPQQIRVERVSFGKPRDAVRYIMKYIMKTIRQGDNIPDSLVINWATRTQTYGASARLYLISGRSFSNGLWEFVGVLPLYLVKDATFGELVALLSDRG